eukprot:UN06204
MCCVANNNTIKSDLVRILSQLALLAQEKKTIDYVLIETTGLADPAPIIRTFLCDELQKSRFRLDGVICFIDTYNFMQQSTLVSKELNKQIAFSDIFVLNKLDLLHEP